MINVKWTLTLSNSNKSKCLFLETYFCDSEVFCPIVACGARLRSLEDFEDHYNTRHTAACSVCSRVYPTSRLLSMHVSEAHDSFFQAKVARGFAMVSNILFLNSLSCGQAHRFLWSLFEFKYLYFCLWNGAFVCWRSPQNMFRVNPPLMVVIVAKVDNAPTCACVLDFCRG